MSINLVFRLRIVGLFVFHRRKPDKVNDYLSVTDVCVRIEYTIQKVYHLVLTKRIKRTIFLVLLFYELKTMTERFC